jgi:chromate transporter
VTSSKAFKQDLQLAEHIYLRFIFRSRAFSVALPGRWNAPPHHVRRKGIVRTRMNPGPVPQVTTGTRPSFRVLLLYFLKLGAFGFGGPIALVGYMQRDLVEDKKWISKEDYFEGLAFSQLCPGPLAAQLAKYIGWLHSGTLGTTLTGGAFILPSFLMVLGLAWLYVHFGQLAWIQGMFYGIGAAVSAIIVRSAWRLIQKTLGKDYLLWALFAALAVTTVWTQSEIVWLFVLSGFVSLLVKAPPKVRTSATEASIVGPWLVTGLLGPASASTVASVFLYFLKAGAFVFGSGLAIVPFLYGGVVGKFHWLTERQFLDAVAVAMITPGPIVITSGFIGYLAAGPVGACAAALAVFLPPYLLVIFVAPYYRRFAQNRQVKALVQGVTAAAVGAIAGAAVILSRRALVDVPTVLIALITLAMLLGFKKVPEPILILAAGVAGIVLHRST